ncbi:MAG: hypothetical protein LBM75_10085 [Myxococcales bacterium]|jgi:Flp pilus assembly pilin Flp|nr:hypothetical protein [Myxococcales bacterium]
MMNKMNSLIRSEEGQGMTEYIIIVALIAIAAIGVITVFGNNLRILFSNSANALAGQETSTTAGKSGLTATKKTLANFGGNQGQSDSLD